MPIFHVKRNQGAPPAKANKNNSCITIIFKAKIWKLLAIDILLDEGH